MIELSAWTGGHVSALLWRRSGPGVASAATSLRPRVVVGAPVQLVVVVVVPESSSTSQPMMVVHVDWLRVVVVVRVPEEVTARVVVVAQMSAVLVVHRLGSLVGYVALLSLPMLYSLLACRSRCVRQQGG